MPHRCILFSSFFFSSRRRHTRSFGDWSSDVCSSDLGLNIRALGGCEVWRGTRPVQRSEERRVGKGVDLGGRRIIKKKKKKMKGKKKKKEEKKGGRRKGEGMREEE